MNKISKKAKRAKFKLVHEGKAWSTRGVHCGLSTRQIKDDLARGKNGKGMSTARAWFIALRAKLFK
jgi:hypothetical protein